MCSLSTTSNFPIVFVRLTGKRRLLADGDDEKKEVLGALGA
jgi:hypothetical protein